MSAATVLLGDCIDQMRAMADNSVDSIVTDPPYGLGFMGKAWDELPPGLDFAEEALRVLKPGGHMLAFGGTRTWHRLAVAIEDAGFDIRDSVAWLYGSGFPKGGNRITARGQAGWGTALKPAFEPIVVARKPFAGTATANVLEHGTGALNIDASRIGDGSGVVTFDRNPGERSREQYRTGTVSNVQESKQGRWPANVMLDESQAAELDRQAPATGGSGKASGPTLTGASRFFYVAKAPKSERPVVDGVAHPTVKPLALMRQLVRLVTPLGGVVLEPFAGSGATVEAALIEGFDVIAIEREADYLPLIQARIDRVA